MISRTHVLVFLGLSSAAGLGVFLWMKGPSVTPTPSRLVPAATFRMGSSTGEDDERPVHEVELKSYRMDVRETTVGEYRVCVREKRCKPPSMEHERCNWGVDGKGQHPINCVSQMEASAYCAFRKKRLPTEAEWEYAAKGKTKKDYPWGDEHPLDRACYRHLRGTCRVGSEATDRSPLGMLDMAGNVAEWTSTSYCRYDGTNCKKDTFVVRGGSWDMEIATLARTTFRDFVRNGLRGSNIGFRCASSVQQKGNAAESSNQVAVP